MAFSSSLIVPCLVYFIIALLSLCFVIFFKKIVSSFKRPLDDAPYSYLPNS